MSEDGGGTDDAESGDGAHSGDAPDTARFLERAVIETHHLANLTGVEAARLARRRLVDAQSAARVTKTRDRIHDAVEYLELARLERRDVAAGFAEARRHALNAEAELAHEDPLRDLAVEDLFDPDRDDRDRTPLRDLAEEAAVDSYEKLRYQVAIDRLFARIRRQVGDGDTGPPARMRSRADSEDLTPEEALALADEELSLQRRHRPRDGDGFEFLTREDLAANGE